jgi:hypothetical protein
MTQIKNENRYGMNRMIWAEGLGQRENRYGMNRIIWIIRIKKIVP